jgi:hypothetical protein
MSRRNELIANALKTIARLDHGVAFVVRGVRIKQPLKTIIMQENCLTYAQILLVSHSGKNDIGTSSLVRISLTIFVTS